MPAKLPGENDLNNAGNPNAGLFVIFDALSGPKGAPLDAKKPATAGGAYVADPGNLSTGGLSTGIGFGCNHIIPPTAPASIVAAGFNDDYIPGVTKNSQASGLIASPDSTIMYIGGGRSTNTGAPNPYTAGFGICGAGNGGSRDSGANTGFGMKMVTATGNVANAAAIEAGFNNRSGVAMISGQSAFGSATVANAAPA